jgi:hypothetical protein
MIGVPINIVIARAHRSMDLSSCSVIVTFPCAWSYGYTSTCPCAFRHPNAGRLALRASCGF